MVGRKRHQMFGHILLKRQKVTKSQSKNACTPSGSPLRRYSEYDHSLTEKEKLAKRHSLEATVSFKKIFATKMFVSHSVKLFSFKNACFSKV